MANEREGSGSESLLDRFLQEHPAGSPVELDAWLARQEVRDRARSREQLQQALTQWRRGQELLLDDGDSSVSLFGSTVEHQVPGAAGRILAPGGTVGHFTLIRSLARGGMGQVWEVSDEQLRGGDRKSKVHSLMVQWHGLGMAVGEPGAVGRLRGPWSARSPAGGPETGMEGASQCLGTACRCNVRQPTAQGAVGFGGQSAVLELAKPGASGEVRFAYRRDGDEVPWAFTSWQGVQAVADFCHQVQISGLVAGVRYSVEAQGRAHSDAPIRVRFPGAFTTAPATDDSLAVTFAVSTCQDFPRRDDPAGGHLIYRSMLASRPSFFVQTSDTLYYDKPPLRAGFVRARADSAPQRGRRRGPRKHARGSLTWTRASHAATS